MKTSDRKLIAALRSGTNWLRVETGRWSKEMVENRKCMVCASGSVEDEEHFLLRCPGYASQRKAMIEGISAKTSWNIEVMRDDSRWMLQVLLGVRIGSKQERSVITMALVKYIKGALMVRVQQLA